MLCLILDALRMALEASSVVLERLDALLDGLDLAAVAFGLGRRIGL